MRLRILSIACLVALIPACTLKDYTFQPVPTISSFNSSSSRIFIGESANLTPVFSNGTGSIDNGVGPVTSGTAYSVSPRADTTYALTVTNDTGTINTATAAIAVETAPVTISTFTASPSQVDFGQMTTLSWTLNGRPTSLTLDGVSVLGNTFQSVSPVRRQTYVLVASNPLGGQMRNLTVAARGVDLLAGALGGPGSLDGTGGAARFSLPFALAVDGAGNVYVADSVNNTIRKITPAGVVNTLAGMAGMPGAVDGPGTTARFRSPAGIAVDGSGNLYVADTGNHTIRKITPAGVVGPLAGLAGMFGPTDGTGTAARFNSPHGVAVDGSGNVYVADTSNSTIRKITPAAVVSTLAGMAGTPGSVEGTGSTARFSFPQGIASDPSGTLYVADTNNHTIRKVVPAGAFGTASTLAGMAGMSGFAEGTGTAARFNSPGSVAGDGSGNLYVADSVNSALRKVVPAGAVGTVSTLAGMAGMPGSVEGTGSVARFNFPEGAALDGSGNIYVADTSNHTIRKVTPSGSVGTVSTLAGLATATGGTEGTGSVARFNGPFGAVVDSVGNAYVADTNNHTIRRITSAGVVSTLAGSGGMPGAVDGPGSTARFRFPGGVAVDGSGNIYVADTSNHTIRKITPAGVVGPLAGMAGMPGQADGTGTAARFNFPQSVAVDGSGNVYVADSSNCTIRKITSAGVVSTPAGTALSCTFADGTGGVARFNSPQAIASDALGNLYVADTFNHTIRKVVPAGSFGTVSTLAGTAGMFGFADGTGPVARFNTPEGIAVDGTGNLYVADSGNYTIRKVTPSGALGAVTTIVGSFTSRGAAPGPLPGSLYFPQGIALTPAGDLIVTSVNSVLQVTAF
jgi:sugar lactone lactonase YvrE